MLTTAHTQEILATARKVSTIVAPREKREDMPVSLLSVIPPSEFEGEHLERLVQKMVKKRGFVRKRSLEDVVLRGMVWMPYYRMQYAYRRSREDWIQSCGKTGRGETALNAMFCGCAGNESDLSMLFRPNYLKHKTVAYSPRSDEIVGPAFDVDFDGVLSRVLKKLNEVQEEFRELRSTLNKEYVRIRRFSVILPARGKLKGTDERSAKIGKLNALKNLFSMCLNLGEDAESIEVLSHSIFYYPTLVATAKRKEPGEAERFFIIDLVKRGLISKTWNLEVVLTKLCGKNDACREVLAKSVTSLS